MRLDDPVDKPPIYNEFEETFPIAMQKLRKEGRSPLASYDILDRRISMFKNHRSTTEARDWWDNYWDSSTACSIDTECNLKITHHAKALYDLTPDSLRNGALPLTVQVYDALEGYSFTKGELDKMRLSQDLTDSKQINSHPIWQALANGDSTLLSDYVSAFMELIDERGWKKQGMGIYFPSVQQVPTMRAWCLGRLGSRSNALGRDSLGSSSNGRLVGKLVPEALDA